MKINAYKFLTLLTVIVLAVLSSCDDGITLIGDPVTKLSNDCIKRSLPIEPNIIGNKIEFAYAMAVPIDMNTILASAQVVASIAGASGTYFDPNSYYTNNSGIDIPILVAETSTNGNTTSATFTKDTCAATLRYYYIIPEEARSKEVSFTFSVKSKNGQTAEYRMGPYKISKMDMTLNKVLTHGNACYISFHGDEAVKIHTAAEIAENGSLASQIDMIYSFNSNADLTHGFFAANAPAEFHPGVNFPSGFVNNTKIIKVYGLRDRQLSDLNSGNFIDDLDFAKKDFSACYNNALKLVNEGGLWIETSDGQYRAFVFINASANNTVTISVKRYEI
jgi:hypothetical protein